MWRFWWECFKAPPWWGNFEPSQKEAWNAPNGYCTCCMRQQGRKFEEIHGAYANGKRMVIQKNNWSQPRRFWGSMVPSWECCTTMAPWVSSYAVSCSRQNPISQKFVRIVMKTKHLGPASVFYSHLVWLKLYLIYLLKCGFQTVCLNLFSPPKTWPTSGAFFSLPNNGNQLTRQLGKGGTWPDWGWNHCLFVDLWRVTGAHHDGALWSRGGFPEGMDFFRRWDPWSHGWFFLGQKWMSLMGLVLRPNGLVKKISSNL